MTRHSEAAFESVIEQHLLGAGYVAVPAPSYDRARAIFPDEVLAFIQQTQPVTWAKLEALHGDRTGEQVLTDLCKWMDAHGSLATLRHGFKCYGRKLHLAFFKAAHGLNPDLDAGYAANRVGITRQLHRPMRHRMGQRHTRCKNQCGNVRPVKVPKVLRCKLLAGSLCDPGFVVVETDHIRTARLQRTRRCKPGPAEPEQGNLSAVECGDRDHAPTSASRLRGRAGQARRK